MVRRGVMRCGAAALLFGATAPIASELAVEANPFTLAGLLYLGAGLAVAPVVARRRARARRWREAAGRLAVAVVAGGAVGPALLAAGLARTPAATASLLLNLELVATTVLAALVFREHVGGRVAAGTALVTAAGVVLAWSAPPEMRLGAALIALACACWAVDNCVTARLDELLPEQVTLAKGLIAGSTNLVVGLAAAPVPSGGVVGAGLAVGAVGYGASITLWVAGARQLGAARGQLVFATAPFLGALVAWLAFGDPLTAAQVVAVGLAAVGVGFVTRSEHEHRHEHAAVVHEHDHDHADGHHHHHHHDDRVGEAPRIRRHRRHRHPHRHEPLVHSHPHVPDLHHRHDHA